MTTPQIFSFLQPPLSWSFFLLHAAVIFSGVKSLTLVITLWTWQVFTYAHVYPIRILYRFNRDLLILSLIETHRKPRQLLFAWLWLPYLSFVVKGIYLMVRLSWLNSLHGWGPYFSVHYSFPWFTASFTSYMHIHIVQICFKDRDILIHEHMYFHQTIWHRNAGHFISTEWFWNFKEHIQTVSLFSCNHWICLVWVHFYWECFSIFVTDSISVIR